jgi:predicted transcriptional regulator of viral defense system
MSAAEAYGELLRLDRPIVETADAAARLRTSTSNASHLLRSMERSGLVRRLRRGLWALRPDIDPAILAPYLTAPYPAYVSLWSALARHDMIEQIPSRVFVASLARTQRLQTPLGDFSIHHLAPELFDGYEGTESGGYLATPEKALFDTVYTRVPSGSRVYFPELSLPDNFDEQRLDQWTDRIGSPRLKTMVSQGLERAVTQAERQTSP